ncbi:DNA-processing protein DprA [Algoriphagus antarcticus]|uniref:Putative Rossmann fold nucleotide-binding protein DprA/Smf involved in DNA uptake n=1 Tax=Algoriphagus antarcticus TaxID=238540 RepID=A0A3E0DWB7_9BACT|nr:DNA-processing protein DprA [Algoriphagus antarcticus]REG87115.1 putative Rossmann fold nucleotide-binding protein DprA/Smf involved in DNA uptake [Algoriphagus antarcticus]
MISERTKAILLLTSYLSKELDRETKPLNIREWNEVVRWMQAEKLTPEGLLTGNLEVTLSTWQETKFSKQRIIDLLDRKMALALKLEKWIKAGVWVINRSDPEYPESIKNALSSKVPPILFGIGDINLLSKDYIGIVGSRNIDEEDVLATGGIVNQIYSQEFGVVSGGAKGVDEHSMSGILDRGGFALGVLADSLIKKSTDGIYRKSIQDNKLVLISPFNPEAGFNVGNAMGRNKLIYILSKATIVVRSETKGGTWSGAEENLKEKYVPLWVNEPKDLKSAKGNVEIVKKGGKWLPSTFEISDLIKVIPKDKEHQVSLFDGFSEPNRATFNQVSEPKVAYEPLKKSMNSPSNSDIIDFKNASFYDFFIYKISEKIGNQAFTKEQIMADFDLSSKQLDEWLKIGVETKVLVKNSKPVSYQYKP